jgi:hypothetical protein
MRTDFESLTDGARITLYPTPENPLHRKAVNATYQGGYFFCDGTNPMDGPDYYMGDVFAYNEGFTEAK